MMSEPKIILIVGASGAGKDTLLRGAARLLRGKNIAFIKRYITRKADENEDNLYLNYEDMQKASEQGEFISFWSAHGNSYAVARKMVQNSKNGMVKFNDNRGSTEQNEASDKNISQNGKNNERKNVISVSRDVISDFEREFEDVVVINIYADKKSLKQRLLSRGRDKNIKGRIARIDKSFSARRVIEFKNEGDVDENIKKFAQILDEI